uniref:OTU domain-containing protein n=1 Tax=Romanomermis culicivorax TaxID=13658 RepID=A0A915JZ58_ROMCU
MTGQVIVEQFERVLQSNKEINLEDPEAVIRIVTVTAPSGSGNHNKQKYFVHHDSLNRGHGGCFITINNKDDNLCLARAVVVAIAMLNKHNPEYQWNTIRTKNPHPRSLQTRKAHELMVRAGLQNHKGPCGIQELNMIQDIIPEYRIKVFSKDAYCAMIFEGKNTDAEKVIHLYHHDDHFTVITSMAAFFMRDHQLFVQYLKLDQDAKAPATVKVQTIDSLESNGGEQKDTLNEVEAASLMNGTTLVTIYCWILIRLLLGCILDDVLYHTCIS